MAHMVLVTQHDLCPFLRRLLLFLRRLTLSKQMPNTSVSVFPQRGSSSAQNR